MSKKIINGQMWVAKMGTNYRVGLTNQGQDDFGKITFALFPQVGQQLATGDTIVELEAEKAVTELVMPFSGTVAAINEEAAKNPSILDQPDEKLAWFVDLTSVSFSEFTEIK